MREAFAIKLLRFFSTKKCWHISDTNLQIFSKTLTKDVVTIEQLGPEVSDLKKSVFNVIKKLVEHVYHAPIEMTS